MPVECPNCHFKNPDDTMYCGKCGTKYPRAEGITVSFAETLESPARYFAKGSLIAGKYRIIEKVGEGGMGVVYKAEDIKLKRSVALKFLSPGLTSDPEAKERFIKEAQTASALEHSNICTIHEIDEIKDGQMFIVMAFYDGEALKEKIQQEPQKLEDALDYTTQIVQGLAKANSKGIVHRDIKPGNIMITDEGVVKIVDFGLAKLGGATRITKTGTTMGTPAYMSPEQVRGDIVDQQADIWSIGVILYEMLTGQLPFKGDHEQAIVYSILNKEPDPITSFVTGIPVELEQIVFKALAKDPKDRYQNAEELLADIQDVYKILNLTPVWKLSVSSKIRRKKWFVSPLLWSSISIIIVVTIGILLFYPSKAIPFSERDWILITDFDNQTGDDVFDQSLDTALTVSLQQSSYVNVFPRSRIDGTLQRMGKAQTEKLNTVLGSEVAQREGIKALVACSINQVGDVYSLTASIIDPNNQVPLWTETNQAKGKDEVLNALDDLAQKTRKELGESLKDIESQLVGLPTATTSSLEALKNYANGQAVWASGQRAEGETLLLKAVELDPDFALAHALLGAIYYWNDNRVKGEEHFTKAMGLLDRLTEREKLWIQSEMAAFRGNRDNAAINYRVYLQKYPDDTRGWHNLGHNYLMLKQWDEAIASFTKVIEINPHSASTYINLATCYSATKDYPKAIENYLKAFDLNPEFLMVKNLNREFGFTYVENGETQKAEEAFAKMLEGNDEQKAGGYRHLALLNMYQGKFLAAIDNLKEAILLNKILKYGLSEMRDHLFLATVYRTTGKMEAFREELHVVDKIRRETYIGPWWLQIAGKLYARTGNILMAKNMLEEISAKINEENRNDRATLNILKGEVELAEGDYTNVVELFETAYTLRPDNYVLESLAYAYSVMGNEDKAIEMYEELINKKNLGWEAQLYWIEAHYRLGKTYEIKEDRINAIQYYQRFLDIWQDADTNIPEIEDAKKKLTRLKGQ